MRGKYLIEVKDRNTVYTFEVKRKVTLITGDSATNKTRLLDLLQRPDVTKSVYNENGIRLKSMYRVINDTNKDDVIEDTYSGKLIFIDEIVIYNYKHELITAMETSDNYFIIITRSPSIIDKRYYERILFSNYEIYKICIERQGIERKYNLVNYIVDTESNSRLNNPIVLTEDKVSGYFFFKDNLNSYKVLSSLGRANIHKVLIGDLPAYNRTHEMSNKDNGIPEFIDTRSNVIVIADGAALGSQMDLIMQSIEERIGRVLLLTPESFEYLLLKILNTSGRKLLTEQLTKTYRFVDTASKSWCSWEEYFTGLLRYYTNPENKDVFTDISKIYDKSDSTDFYKFFSQIINLLSIDFLLSDKTSVF